MIRSSALLIAVALALLAAGVFASSLELVYISIGISILAALVLSAGVLLRRGEIFGTAGAERQGAASDRPAADGAGVPALAGGRAENGSVEGGSVKDGAVRGGLGVARRDRTESAGREPAAAGGTGSGAGWPRRTGRDAAASGRDRAHAAFGDREEAIPRPGKEPAAWRAREEAASAPDEDQVASWEGRPAARQDRERAGSRDDRVRAASGRDIDEAASWDKRDTAPAGREPAALWDDGRAGPSRRDKDTAASGTDEDQVASRPRRRAAASGKDRDTAASRREREQAAAERDRDRAGSSPGRQAAESEDRDVAASREERRAAESKREREQAAADRGRDRARSSPGRQAAASLDDRDAAPERDRDKTASSWPEGFRVPPFGDRRAVASAGEEGRGSADRRRGDSGLPRRQKPAPIAGSAAAGTTRGSDLWTRASGEPASSGTHDPARPAWPTSAGPRAMGTGSAKPPPAPPGDGGPEPPGAKAPTADSGAPRSLFTPRVPAQPRPAEDADVAEDAVPASRDGGGGARDLSGPGDLGGQAADDARDAGETAGTGDVPSGAAAAADEAPGTGKADEPAGAVRAGQAGQARDVGSRDADSPDAGSRDDGSVSEPGTTTESSKAAGKDGVAGAADAAPERKPAPAGDRKPKPGEKPDKPSTDEGDGSGATPLDGEVTIVPGISRYHRRGCILIRFLSDGDLETMTRGEAEAAGSIPCKACQPEKPVSEH